MSETNILQICALLLIISLFTTFLKNCLPTWSYILSITTGILLFLYIITKSKHVITEIYNIFKFIKVDIKYSRIIFKNLAICIIVQFTSNSLRDKNETALAFIIELIGKIFILIISIPIFYDFINIILKLLA